MQLAKSEEEKEKDEARAADDQAMYFVTIGTAERGPFSAAQIRELVVAGRIDASSALRVDGQSGPKRVAEILS